MSADPLEPRLCDARPDRGGAKRRLEALYAENIEQLRAYLAGVLRSAADADDVAQEAFLRLLRCPDLGAYKNLRAVLFKTGHRLALNVIRSRRSNPLDRADTAFDLEGVGLMQAETPEDALIENEQEAAYVRALQRLSPRCRQVIELRTVSELTYKEISDTLGVSVSTLEKHLNRGKRV
ncbi:MAG: sigma-70 family RNA polymerase sigma factor, partial [Hyphomonadaceae bacterium]|nr:sigma-70 family RNA polymerase sigma factor [Hyphomonadaceae bacterium]